MESMEDIKEGRKKRTRVSETQKEKKETRSNNKPKARSPLLQPGSTSKN